MCRHPVPEAEDQRRLPSPVPWGQRYLPCRGSWGTVTWLRSPNGDTVIALTILASGASAGFCPRDVSLRVREDLLGKCVLQTSSSLESPLSPVHDLYRLFKF